MGRPGSSRPIELTSFSGICSPLIAMLTDHLEAQLLRHLGHEPTAGQRRLFQFIPRFIMAPEKDEVLMVKGYAGTGKTTAMRSLVRTLQEHKLKVELLAPTGRAAKVLQRITGRTAYTIHKKIYRQRSSRDGFGTFVLDKNLHYQTIFIVDEASMISNTPAEGSVFGRGKLLDDLLYYVYSGAQCKLILVGDTAQLPPVGRTLSPALEHAELQSHAFSVHEFFLEEVVRQKKESGILVNATLLRKSLEVEEVILPQLRLDHYPDIQYVYGTDILELLGTCYDRAGQEETMVVVRSNKQANKYNAGIRSRILWKEEEITKGDLLMVVKNNYFWMTGHERLDFIANGDICEITNIHGFEERYGYRFADLSIRLIDYDDLEMDVKVLLETLNIESASLTAEQHQDLFYTVAEDYAEVSPKKKRWEKVRNDPFFNALQVKFAYAVTCHKAQGGQWKNVFVDHGYFTDDMLNREYLRWLYTAFTRTTEHLYLVNFSKKFFPEGSVE
jgi:exodeoxyribonuclease-5